jgi:hypothetical protein
LPAGDIHLWLCPHGDSGDPALDATYRALLTPQELQQKDRFHFPRDRHRYLLTRVLVRTVLSRYAPDQGERTGASPPAPSAAPNRWARTSKKRVAWTST